MAEKVRLGVAATNMWRDQSGLEEGKQPVLITLWLIESRKEKAKKENIG